MLLAWVMAESAFPPAHSAESELWMDSPERHGPPVQLSLLCPCGKRHEVPCHHSLDEYLEAWIAAAGIGDDKKGPLFRSFKKGDKLTGNLLSDRQRLPFRLREWGRARCVLSLVYWFPI